MPAAPVTALCDCVGIRKRLGRRPMAYDATRTSNHTKPTTESSRSSSSSLGSGWQSIYRESRTRTSHGSQHHQWMEQFWRLVVLCEWHLKERVLHGLAFSLGSLCVVGWLFVSVHPSTRNASVSRPIFLEVSVRPPRGEPTRLSLVRTVERDGADERRNAKRHNQQATLILYCSLPTIL